MGQGGGLLQENILGFGRLLRRSGLSVDTSRIALATQAAGLVGLSHRQDFKDALEAVLVSREQDRQLYSDCFELYFRTPEFAGRLKAAMPPPAAGQSVPPPMRRSSPPAMVQPPTPGVSLKTFSKIAAAMGWGSGERLRQADFSSLQNWELRQVERMARQIPMTVPQMPSRRTRGGGRSGRLDWRRCLREANRSDGEWIRLFYRRRRSKPLPLLLLVDVSGSMERYARVLLTFLHKATDKVPRQIYCFGSHLSDLNEAFAQSDTDEMLRQANQLIKDYAGGTRMAKSIASLRDEHRARLVGGRTLVLLVSDGLDMGYAEPIAKELDWLVRHSRRLIWLNPLLRYEHYEPLSTGGQLLSEKAHAALPIHNLLHLENLAKGLEEALQAGR